MSRRPATSVRSHAHRAARFARSHGYAALLVVILAYGAFLRFDGLFKTYGPFDGPRWLAGLHRVVAATPWLVPERMAWPPHDFQADGGDPVNYLKFAREMRGFYQAHVREPVFLAVTRIMLAVVGGRDVAVSLASILFSLGLVAATYLLGAGLGSRAVGLGAAAVMASDYDVISWSIAGWRDDASAFFCVLAAWAIVTLRDRPGTRIAVGLGLIAGLACLTRITSVVYLAPGLLWVAFVGPRDGRAQRMRHTALAGSVALLLMAPYLVNCAREFGDPLYSINYHVRFYAAREQARPPLEDDEASRLPGAGGYVMGKFRANPLEAMDIAIQGLTSLPFNSKFMGLDIWIPGLTRATKLLALVGLLSWLLRPRYHLVLVILAASLAPYMMTWPIPGGAEWRFTMHAYPFFLVAAFGVLLHVLRGSGELLSGSLRLADLGRNRWEIAWQAAVISAVLVLGFGVAYGLPYLLARQTLVQGRPAYLMSGSRDKLVLTSGWSDLVTLGNVTARCATRHTVVAHVPLPRRQSYTVVLRMDPLHYDGAPPQHVSVAVDGHALAEFTLAWNPERVGTYTFDVPRHLTPSALARVELTSSRVDPVSRAGDALPELARDQIVGFKLWYVGVIPQQP